MVPAAAPHARRAHRAQDRARTPAACGASTDRTLLESALLNLAVNAKDAMPQGGTLTITHRRARRGPGRGRAPGRAGRSVFVTVSDTGTGMSARGAGARLRAVLHHQGGRQGLGAGALDGVRLRPAVGRPRLDREPRRARAPPSRSCCPRSAATRRRRRARRGARAGRRGRERVPRGRGRAAGAAVRVGPAREPRLRGHGGVDRRRTRSSSCERGAGSISCSRDVVLPEGDERGRAGGAGAGSWPGLKVLLTSGYAEEAFEHHGSPEPAPCCCASPTGARSSPRR